MKINKYVSVLGIATSLALVGCDDSDPEVLLTDCQLATSVFVNAETLFEEEVTVCGTSPANLQEKLDDLAARNTQITDEFNAPDPEPVVPDPIEILNFDGLTSEFTPFNGAESMVVDNPNLSGSNDTASQVLQINNTATANFEGVASAALESDIDFGAMSSKTITVDVFSEQEVVVDFQVKRNENEVTLEDPRGASLKVNHTGSGWETLTFDFNAGAVQSFDGFAGDGDAFVPEGQFNQIVILVDGGAPASLGAGTYFIDNILLVVEGENTSMEPEPTISLIPVLNFDDLTNEFSPFNGAETMIVDNPNLTGSNDTASQVLQINNTVTANFEGVSSAALESDIDFGAMSSKTITVDVFSEQEVVVDFQVKRNENEVTLESPRGASLKVTHTGSGWETLTFDYNAGAVQSFDGFAGDGDAFVPEGQFNQVVILVDGGSPASLGAATYFVDNINFVEN